MADRTPPHDLPAEEALIGAIMVSRHALDDSAHVVAVDDFYSPFCGQAFEAALALAGVGDPVDSITVAARLDYDDAHNRLLEMLVDAPSIGAAVAYAGRVARLARLRRVAEAAAEIRLLVLDPGPDPDAAVSQAEHLMYAATRGRSDRSDAVPLSTAIDQVVTEMESVDSPLVPTGHHDIDLKLGGLRPGGLYVVGGRPSMGKTALGISIALAAAETGPVLFVSLEMTAAEIAMRLLCGLGRLESDILRRNRPMNDAAVSRFVRTVERLNGLPLFIDENPAAGVAGIAAAARRVVTRDARPLVLLVVDYLQLMDPGHAGESRQQEVAEISRGLKRLAGTLACPVLAMSQLHRGVEARNDKRPVLSDLRESGAIEQDADVVMMLYRHDFYHPDDPDTAGLAEVHIAKHRNGPTGLVTMQWDAPHAWFRALARPDLVEKPARTAGFSYADR